VWAERKIVEYQTCWCL